MQETVGSVAAAREAVALGRWAEALAALDQVAELDESAEGLELLATASYGVTTLEATVAAWERLHALHVRRGEPVEAARAGAMIAMFLMMDSGLMAAVRGWIARVERLLGDRDDTPVHALAAAVHTYERFMAGDHDRARMWAARAVELGVRHDVEPAHILGRTAGARLQLLGGDVDGGLAALDELAVLLLSGDVAPLVSGIMMCELVCAMQGLAQYDRAEEWSAAFESMRATSGFVGALSGRCRVHRAEILRLRGDCAEAEAEAQRACDELRPWMRRELGWPLTELGTIRLRRGDLAGAEEAFVAAHASGWDPHPGLALVRFAQGDATAALRLVSDALEHPVRVPSKERPPVGGLSRAPLLEVQTLLSVAVGDLTTAATAADELGTIAAIFRSRALAAAAALARGRVAVARGDGTAAVTDCRVAVEEWCVIGAPFEAAVARLALADAYDAAHEPALAAEERSAAQAGLDEIGAVVPTPGSQRAATAEDGVTAHTGGDADADEAATVFRRSGDTRLVRYLDEEAVVRDLVGLRYLERLLAHPGRELHVLDLVRLERAPEAGTATRVEVGALPSAGGDAGPMLDDQARRAYRNRLDEIEEDLADAERTGDAERAELAEADREFILAELARAFGLGGRSRAAGSTSERARGSVTRSVRYALGKLREHAPRLAEHLEHTVHTGTFCSYRPDPAATPLWTL